MEARKRGAVRPRLLFLIESSPPISLGGPLVCRVPPFVREKVEFRHAPNDFNQPRQPLVTQHAKPHCLLPYHRELRHQVDPWQSTEATDTLTAVQAATDSHYPLLTRVHG